MWVRLPTRARLFPRPPAGGPWPTAPSGTQRARGGLVGGATPAPSVPCVSPEVTCWRDGGGCLPDDDCPLWCARRQETCLDRTVGMDFSLLSNVTARSSHRGSPLRRLQSSLSANTLLCVTLTNY